jgi:hypothetical protein
VRAEVLITVLIRILIRRWEKVDRVIGSLGVVDTVDNAATCPDQTVDRGMERWKIGGRDRGIGC